MISEAVQMVHTRKGGFEKMIIKAMMTFTSRSPSYGRSVCAIFSDIFQFLKSMHKHLIFIAPIIEAANYFTYLLDFVPFFRGLVRLNPSQPFRNWNVWFARSSATCVFQFSH